MPFHVIFTLLLSSSLTLLHSECNLLSSSTSYIETESEASINTMCSKDTNELSLWEQYQCEYIINIDGWQKCWPQRRMSTCAPGDLKGILFLYHGYSACPGEYNQLAPQLQANCWDVYQLLTVGHGYNYCNESSCVAGQYNASGLPINRQGYIDFVQRMVSVITDEVSIIKECEASSNPSFNADDIEVVISGLSFGAPLTAGTVLYSGNPSIFTKQIVMSPFFGITYNGLDNAIYKCLLNVDAFTECLPMYFEAAGFQVDDAEAEALSDMVVLALTNFVDLDNLDSSFETFNLMVRKVLEWIIENPNAIDDTDVAAKINSTLETTFGWGPQCGINEDERDRGGFCKFRLKNLFAAHSFAMYVRNDLLMKDLVEVDTSMEMLMILIERDGPTRNSLNAQYINLYYDYKDALLWNNSDNCMWMIEADCQDDSYNGSIDNTCGVPHASLSEASNLGIPPGYLYWEDDYHNGLITWLNNEDIFPDNFIVKDEAWDLTRDQCVYVDLTDPPPSLIADVPSLLTIGINVVGGVLTETVKNDVLGDISELTGVPRGVLELTYNVVLNTAYDDTKGDYVELVMTVDRDSAKMVNILAENDAFTMVSDYDIEYVEVGGEQFYPQGNVPESEDKEEEEDSDAGEIVGYIFIGALVVAAAVFIAVVVSRRKKREKIARKLSQRGPDEIPMARAGATTNITSDDDNL